MEKRLLKRIIASLLCVELLSILLVAGFVYFRAQSSVFSSMDKVLNQEEEFYLEAKRIQMEKNSYYVNDYLTRISVIDYMLSGHPVMNTQEHMQELRTLFNIEGIYAFDADGRIVMSSEPEAVGTGLAEGENAAPFQELIEGGGDNLVFSFEAEEILEYGPGLNYIAMHSAEEQYRILMIGVERSVARGLIEEASAAGLLQHVPATGSEALFAVDAASGEIVGESRDNDPALELEKLGSREEMRAKLRDAADGKVLWLGSTLVFLKARQVEDVILVSLRRGSTQIYQALFMLLGITFILLTSTMVIVMVSRRYFRKFVFNEIDMMQNTIQRQMAGEEDALFRDGSEELRPITDALNAWIYSISHTRDKLNWALSATDSHTAIFEEQSYINSIYWSDNMQAVLGADEERWASIRDDAAAFTEYVSSLYARRDPAGITEFNGRCLQISLFQLEKDAFGIISDRTEEIRDRYRQENALQEAVDASEKESMTGLFNRRGFERRVGNALESGENGMTMLMIDVDNFKQVNDAFGHPVGDQVLQRIASVLKRQFRRQDTVARLGGDEFAVLLSSGIPLEQLEAKLRSVLEMVEEELKNFGCGLSVSIGAAWTDSPVRYEELYQWADEALYDAKRAGKSTYSISRH